MKALLSSTAPWATIFLCAVTAIYTVVGGAVVIWGDPGALSFEEYGNKLVWFAGALGILGVGRGIASSGEKPKKK